MAQAKLWTRHSIIRVLMMGLLATFLASCRADDKPIGMTLLFQSAGRPVGVRRFDPDGVRGPVPGSVGGMFPRGGAQMSFMPGDSKRGMPQFVDVAWVVSTPEYEQWIKNRDSLPNSVRYSPQGIAESKLEGDKQPQYTKRIDLTPIITPELIAQVRANVQTTQLKLIITFNNDDVNIEALAYKWR
ncbi:hypothetical protein [Collimonas antrihumi]|uniref:hypothetical protein n=1 Tax=Collimonas antrihumi TaxID=1940615 RepID=UPI001B8B9582|nr:hypothetical protein [Collimonas antrihumi]